MAIEFTGASGQSLEFANANVNNLTIRSISFWVNFDALPAGQKNLVSKTGAGWSVHTVGDDLYLLQGFSGGPAGWSVNNLLAAGNWYHIAISYDASNAANDPTLYINGALQALSTDTISTGSMSDDSDGSFFLGSTNIAGYELDGKIEDPRIYNRILSAAEVAELYNSRMVRSVLNGLVFHPIFCGAKGLSQFDGVTLGAANTIVDDIGGAIGVPSGNPIGRGNTIQRIY